MTTSSQFLWKEHLRQLMSDADYESAEDVCYERLRVNPSETLCLIMLGQIAGGKGDFRDAIIMYRKATEASPEEVEPWVLLATVLIETKQSEDAESALDKAFRLNPDHIEARKLLAYLRVSSGQINAAVEIYEWLLEQKNDDRAVLEGLGNSYRVIGKRKLAVEAYRRWAGLYPEDGNAWWSLANLKNYSFSDVELRHMKDHLSQAAGTESQMRFALGQAFEERGEYKTAFRHYSEANRLARDNEAFFLKEHEALIEHLLTFPWASRSIDKSPLIVPIFVVGMPRSGTTLIEQILASHSVVDGRGELSALGDLVVELEQYGENFPAVLSDIDGGALSELGERYLQAAGVSGGFFVDKTPNNFLLIGLIKLILPQAKIIHARRHPMATCFSCFKQRFGRGQSYSYDLYDLSQYYLLYIRLMGFWHRLFPGAIYDVEYEELVRNPHNSIKGLLKFCGLPFERHCVDFHRTDRIINSASSEQVREPLYQDSLDQWRYFEPFLGGLSQSLSAVLAEKQTS